MILNALKDHIQKHPAISLKELSDEFHRDPDIIASMVEHWIKKGEIQKTTKTSACQKVCHQCDANVTVIYSAVTS